jgi:hypothetical protein
MRQPAKADQALAQPIWGLKLSSQPSHCQIRKMKFLALLAANAALVLAAYAADADSRVFEMRTYYAAQGKLDALHARFRDHTTKLFEKHGITNIGYWVPIAAGPDAPDNPDNKLIYVLAYPSREARDQSWKEFGSDPDWKKAQSDSEKGGKIVAKVEQLFMTATDYSPHIEPMKGTADRVFELRTYTCTPGNLPLLDARFRDHTVKLFTKHGITNLFYWHLLPDQPKADAAPRADVTLVYMLAHPSVDAAKASFDEFRKDPDWVAAKEASEKKGGGSLTIAEGGVKSVFLKATDYSPTK